MKTWSCKIGEIDRNKLPDGADLPIRKAVIKAYFDLTGEYPKFTFSGWGGELSNEERFVADYDFSEGDK